jgi:GTPase SAR1 family protein
MKQKTDFEAKIVMVGDVGVGKSSITVRYVLDKFNEKI